MKRNVRLVLPGEYVLDRMGRPNRVHHVEVTGNSPTRSEVAICLSKGPHPDREADHHAPWPIMWRGIDDEVEVVPAPPKLIQLWDGDQWVFVRPV